MLDGVYVANVTPFAHAPSYAVDVDAYLAHVRWLADQGVDGIIPFGTNGEGPSVAVGEKREVLDALFRADPPIDIVPTVAEGNLPDTVAMLEHLNGVELTGVLVLPPYYFKPVATEGLRLFYERVLEISRHPVIVYHIPKYGVPVPADLVTSLPVWGVKDSEGAPGYAETVHDSGRGVMLGTEDDYPGRLGTAAGVISALANIVPEQVLELYRSVRAGEVSRAAELSDHLQRVRALTKEHASPAVLKAMAQARHGAAMGTVRPPLLPLPRGYDAHRGLRALEVSGTA
jgi:dihydrodipicolinate synthase/N-acetylneuraminate lyase